MSDITLIWGNLSHILWLDGLACELSGVSGKIYFPVIASLAEHLMLFKNPYSRPLYIKKTDKVVEVE